MLLLHGGTDVRMHSSQLHPPTLAHYTHRAVGRQGLGAPHDAKVGGHVSNLRAGGKGLGRVARSQLQGAGARGGGCCGGRGGDLQGGEAGVCLVWGVGGGWGGGLRVPSVVGGGFGLPGRIGRRSNQYEEQGSPGRQVKGKGRARGTAEETAGR